MTNANPTLAELVNQLNAASQLLVQRVSETDAARSAETSARNVVNQLQTAVDKSLAQLKKIAPLDTDWKRPRGVEVGE